MMAGPEERKPPVPGEGRAAGQGAVRIPLVPLIAVLCITTLGLGFLLGSILFGTKPPSPSSVVVEEGKRIEHWTCSMDPQVRRSGPGSCPICGMDLIPVYADIDTGEEAGTDVASPRQVTLTPRAIALADIETVPVERRIVEAQVRMAGKIAYDETRLSYVTARVPGRIDRLFVDYTGITVREGDHMVYLYSPELYQGQEELLEAAKAVESYGPTAQGPVLERARRTLEAAEERMRLWGLTEKQIEDIVQSGKPSDHMTIYAPIGGIVIHKHGTEGMYVQTGTRIYTIADLKQVWVVLDAYESDLSWIRYGQSVAFTTESYPGEVFQGRIAFIEPFLNEATRTVGVRVNAANKDGRLKPGMFVRATVRAQVAAGGKVIAPDLAGRWICPMHPEIIRGEAGSCDVCGMPLETVESLGYVRAEPAEAPLVIPVTAPLITGKRAIVYVKAPGEEGRTFEGREIVLGPRAGGWYIVRAGLREGERVVTKGNFKIDSELQIRAKPSMMNPEGGAPPAHHHGAPGTKADAEPGGKHGAHGTGDKGGPTHHE